MNPTEEQRRTEGLAGNAAENSYVAPDGSLPGVLVDEPQMDIIGANGRRLIVRWTPEGVWIGGVLITRREDAEELAAFIVREDESE